MKIYNYDFWLSEYRWILNAQVIYTRVAEGIKSLARPRIKLLHNKWTAVFVKRIRLTKLQTFCLFSENESN